MWRGKPLTMSPEGCPSQGDSASALPGGHSPCSLRAEPRPCPSQKDFSFPTFSSSGQFPGLNLMRLGAILGNFINMVGCDFFFLSPFLA